jgi:hypothetical protein
MSHRVHGTMLESARASRHLTTNDQYPATKGRTLSTWYDGAQTAERDRLSLTEIRQEESRRKK